VVCLIVYAFIGIRRLGVQNLRSQVFPDVSGAFSLSPAQQIMHLRLSVAAAPSVARLGSALCFSPWRCDPPFFRADNLFVVQSSTTYWSNFLHPGPVFGCLIWYALASPLASWSN